MSRASTAPVSLEQAVGERRLPVVDVGDDAEAADAVEAAVTDPPFSPIRVCAPVPSRLDGAAWSSSGRRTSIWCGTATLPAPGETVTDGEFTQVLGRQGREPGRGRGRARRRGAVRRLRRRRRARRARCAPISTARGVDCRRVSATRRDATGVALIMVDARRRERRSRSRPARTARSQPDAVAGHRSGPTTSCCAPARSRSTRSKPRSTRRLARGATVIVNPGAAARRARGAILTPNEHECARARRGRHAARGRAGRDRHPGRRAGAVLHRPGRDAAAPAGVRRRRSSTPRARATRSTARWRGRWPTGATLARDAVRLACAAGALATRPLGARASLPTAAEVYALATA